MKCDVPVGRIVEAWYGIVCSSGVNDQYSTLDILPVVSCLDLVFVLNLGRSNRTIGERVVEGNHVCMVQDA